ncbi:MAG: hypothetical protein R6U56_06515 [Opitutales bacterium]
MKIALVTETYPPEVNGVAMTNQRLVRGLLDLGHELLLIKPRRVDAPDLNSGQLSIHEVFGIPIPNYAVLKIGLPAPGQLKLLEQSADLEQKRPLVDIASRIAEHPPIIL